MRLFFTVLLASVASAQVFQVGANPYLMEGAQNNVKGVVQTNDFTHPAHPGDYVSVWGIGLAASSLDQVKVLLGGHPAPVLYAGSAPELPHRDQINFQVPNDAAIPDGCFVAVQVEVQGVASNTIAISKSSGMGDCTPPFDLTADQMVALDAGGTVPFARFQIAGSASAPAELPSLAPASPGFLRNESLQVSVFPLNETGLFFETQPLLAEDAFYGCSLTPLSVVAGLFASAGSFGSLDLGPSLTLTGPGTTAHMLPDPGFFDVFSIGPPTVGMYEVSLPTGPPVSFPDYLPPPYFVPGVWQVSGTGAEPNPYTTQQSAAEPFQVQITLPPTLQLTNYASLQNIDSRQGMTVQWNSSGYSSADVVTVTVGIPFLTIVEILSGYPQKDLSAALPLSLQSVTCRAHATDGQISIPSNLLGGLDSNSYFQISLMRRPDQAVRADVPLQSGGAAPGIFSYNFIESFPVQIH